MHIISSINRMECLLLRMHLKQALSLYHFAPFCNLLYMRTQAHSLYGYWLCGFCFFDKNVYRLFLSDFVYNSVSMVCYTSELQMINVYFIMFVINSSTNSRLKRISISMNAVFDQTFVQLFTRWIFYTDVFRFTVDLDIFSWILHGDASHLHHNKLKSWNDFVMLLLDGGIVSFYYQMVFK